MSEDADNAGKKLNVRERLQYALAAVAVLRTLETTDQRMRFSGIAKAIGLMPPDGPWKVWYRQRVAEILQVAAAVERQAGEIPGVPPINFSRVVDEHGKPCAGVSRNTRIVSTPEGA